MSQIGHRQHAGIRGEAQREFAVSGGVEDRERLLEMGPCAEEVSLEMLRDALDALRDSRNGRARRIRHFPLQRVGIRPHRPEVSPGIGARPEAEGDLRTGRVAGREFARPLERRLRLRRVQTPPVQQRAAIGDMQIDALLA